MISPPPMAAYEVLQNLSILPGQSPDGSFDTEKLLAWVRTARDMAKAVHRVEAFDEALGDWFANSPLGSDGMLPHEAVREVFQELESDDFERGFEVGIFNSRGVVERDPEEGGEQERELAAKYKAYADALGARWHRAARAMRSLSESYLEDAKRVDRRRGLE